MMHKLVLVLVPLAAAVALQERDATTPASPRVVEDQHNVVASALIGDWVPDPQLWKRLQGEELELPPGGSAPLVTFARDDEVAARVPELVWNELPAGAHLAGTISGLFREEPVPFVLSTFHGNPHVVWFQPRDGDPMGDVESFNVQLVLAKDKGEDLLFIGSDFQTRHEAFKPFRRAKPRGATGGIMGRLRTARVAKAKADMVTIEQGLANFAIQNGGRYPDELQALVTPDENGFTYLRASEIPKDPWGGDYIYEPPAGKRTMPSIRCLGADGKSGGDGEDLDFDTEMIRDGKV